MAISTFSGAYDAVRFRDTDKGQHQSGVLRRFESDSKRKRSAIVADLDAEINVGHDQYRRYLRGDTPLRWDQIDVFARALGSTKAELTRALGLLDDTAGADQSDDPSWDFRAELERVYADDPRAAADTLKRFEHESQAMQRTAIEAAEIAQGIAAIEPDASDGPPRHRAIAG